MGAHLDRRAAANARRRVLRSEEKFWTPADFDLPESTTLHLLGHLVRQGELRRVRRGLYWRGTKTPLGMSPPRPNDVIKVLTPVHGVGPAGLTAANMLRLSTQVPRNAEYAVPGRAPAPAASVRFVSRAARTGRISQRLTEAEVATLEVLDAWDKVLEVPPNEAMERLSGLIKDYTLRPDRLAKAAINEPGPAQGRLKALLSYAGHDNLTVGLKGRQPANATAATGS